MRLIRVLLGVALPGVTAAAQPACLRTPIMLNVGTSAVGTLTAINDPAVSKDYLGVVLNEIRQTMRPPVELPLQVFFADSQKGSRAARTAMMAGEATVRFDVLADGTVEHLRPESSSLVPALDSAALRAVMVADSTHVVPAPFDERVTPPLHLRLAVAVATSWGERSFGGEAKVSTPFWNMMVPEWQGSTPPGIEGMVSKFVIPNNARQTNSDGGLFLQYVVDEDGRVVPPTFLIIGGTQGDFAESARRFVADARFKPATVGGCPAKWLWFEFVRWRAHSSHPA